MIPITVASIHKRFLSLQREYQALAQSFIDDGPPIKRRRREKDSEDIFLDGFSCLRMRIENLTEQFKQYFQAKTHKTHRLRNLNSQSFKVDDSIEKIENLNRKLQDLLCADGLSDEDFKVLDEYKDTFDNLVLKYKELIAVGYEINNELSDSELSD